MRKNPGTRLLLFAVVVGMVLFSVVTVADAQCSMCRASLAGSNNAFFIRNFNLGVLVLLVPPVAMFCSFFVVLRKHALHKDEEAESKGSISR